MCVSNLLPVKLCCKVFFCITVVKSKVAEKYMGNHYNISPKETKTEWNNGPFKIIIQNLSLPLQKDEKEIFYDKIFMVGQ